MGSDKDWRGDVVGPVSVTKIIGELAAVATADYAAAHTRPEPELLPCVQAQALLLAFVLAGRCVLTECEPTVATGKQP